MTTPKFFRRQTLAIAMEPIFNVWRLGFIIDCSEVRAMQRYRAMPLEVCAVAAGAAFGCPLDEAESFALARSIGHRMHMTFVACLSLAFVLV